LTEAPRIAPSDAVGAIAASPGVAIIAVGESQQLHVDAVSLTGEPIALDSVVYRINTVSDTARIKLDPNGLVTALAPSTGTMYVNVFGYKHGAVKADQVVLQTTAAEIPNLQLSIQPLAGDSARLAAGTSKTIAARIRNTAGDSIVRPVIRYTVHTGDSTRVAVYIPQLASPAGQLLVSHPTILSAGVNQIRPLVGEGSAWIYATVNAFGTELKDSVLYTFTYPITQYVSFTTVGNGVVSSHKGQVVTLERNATVTFSNDTYGLDGFALTITFDDPAGATAASPPSTTGGTSGNITALSSGQSSDRRFATPGTYKWTVHADGLAPFTGQTFSGTLVIK
jgi:hypothetical protein